MTGVLLVKGGTINRTSAPFNMGRIIFSKAFKTEPRYKQPPPKNPLGTEHISFFTVNPHVIRRTGQGTSRISDNSIRKKSFQVKLLSKIIFLSPLE